MLIHVQLFETPWTVAHQAPLSMGFSRQEDWSGLLFSSPGNLLSPGIKPAFLALQADSLPSELPGKPHSPMYHMVYRVESHWLQLLYMNDLKQLKRGLPWWSSRLRLGLPVQGGAGLMPGWES